MTIDREQATREAISKAKAEYYSEMLRSTPDEQIIGDAIGYRQTAKRLEEARAYCGGVPGDDKWGKDVWHVVLDDAKRLRDLRQSLQAQLEETQRENERLNEQLSRLDSHDPISDAPVSFASVMDGIDSADLQERIYDLVIWHIRAHRQAESKLSEAQREIEYQKSAMVHARSRVDALSAELAEAKRDSERPQFASPSIAEYVSRLESQLTASRARDERLRPYLQHLPGCGWQDDETFDRDKCTCGLSALLTDPIPGDQQP